jgi:hypothetical protein
MSDIGFLIPGPGERVTIERPDNFGGGTHHIKCTVKGQVGQHGYHRDGSWSLYATDDSWKPALYLPVVRKGKRRRSAIYLHDIISITDGWVEDVRSQPLPAPPTEVSDD